MDVKMIVWITMVFGAVTEVSGSTLHRHDNRIIREAESSGLDTSESAAQLDDASESEEETILTMPVSRETTTQPTTTTAAQSPTDPSLQQKIRLTTQLLREACQNLQEPCVGVTQFCFVANRCQPQG